MATAPPARALSIPSPLAASPHTREGFFQSVRDSANPLLVCDYDGTLAPFCEDKMQAVVYPGVAERLERIAAGRGGLAFVSGRPVGELITLLPLAARVECWGMHGRQHRAPDGQCREFAPSQEQRNALDQAQDFLRTAGYGELIERKIGSVGLHWRRFDPERNARELQRVHEAAQAAFIPHTGHNEMALLPFDGGVELRAEDYTKAHAVDALLASADARASAFLGDDTTDEDAFRAMAVRGGLSVLVREQTRPSHARFSIHPPGELLTFLDAWEQALHKN